MNQPDSLRFGRIELQAHERRLLIDGEPRALGARAFDLLLALAERPGRLVGKRELMELVWPGLVVQENNLAAQISALRKVLGDDLVATIPGRGYRFVGRPLARQAVDVAAPAPAAPRPEADAALRDAAPRTNLPATMRTLLGRDDDLSACGALVDAHRLVSIVGAGGIGKSLLVTHLLHQRRGRYPQGVCWVELAQVTDAGALPGALAAALGADVGRGEPCAALVSALAPLDMLLALDNAEHLLGDVAALVRQLLDAAPKLRIVLTSQAPLKLPTERVYRIGPLSLPAVPVSAADALAFGAVALFVDRAKAVDARFELGDGNAGAVIEIVRALDGLPLAIELAAARVPLLGLQALLSSMRDRLQVLTAGRDRDAPARQRTLRAALEWSLALLAPREQRVFRRLGVITGSAALDLLRTLLIDPDDGLDPWGVLDALDVLVERSLLTMVSDDDAPAPRYRLLESPRALALEQLEAAGERQVLAGRHARGVAALFDAAYEGYFSGEVGVDDWLRRLEPDLDNARDALGFARAAGDLCSELQIAATLLRALPSSAHTERMTLADAVARRLAEAAPVPAALQQRVWIELGCVWANAHKQLARQASARALALALEQPDGDRFMRYHALARCASAAAQTDDLAGAAALLAQVRALEDPRWPAHRRLWGAEAAQWVARMGGDAAEALRRGRELVALDRERGSDAVLALGNLVDAGLAAGDAQGAARAGAQLVAALEGTRHEYSLAFARINLAAAWLALDDVARARPALLAAWDVSPAFELAHPAACYLALLAALEQRPDAAARIHGFAEAEYRTRREAREGNESAALARTEALARPALGEAGWLRACAEGASLRSADIAALAFGDAAGV